MEATTAATATTATTTSTATTSQVFYFKLADEGDKIFSLPGYIVQQSETMMNLVGDSMDTEEIADLPTFEISRKNLALFEDYYMYHHTNPGKIYKQEAKSTRIDAKTVCEFDQRYRAFSLEDLNSLAEATKYLGASQLYKLCIHSIVYTYIRGKTPDEIRMAFGLPDDLSEEDKLQIRKEAGWA